MAPRHAASTRRIESSASRRGIVRLLVVAGVALGATFAPPQIARADSSLVATGTVSSGFSNNILGVPDTDDPTAPQVESDLFMNLSPGVAAAYESRRAIHNLAYLFTARLFASHSEANSFSNRLSYLGLYYLTPVSNLRLTAGLSAGRVNTFDRLSSDIVEVTDDLPRGDLAFVAAQVQAAYSRQLGPFWSFGSSLGLRGYTPTNTDNVGSNYAVPATLSLSRNFRYHILTASLRATFSSNSRSGATDDQQAVAGGPQVSWTWDIAERWSSNAFGGLTAVVEAPEFERGIVLPTGGASLNYSTGRGRASIGYRHEVAANILTSDITLANRYVAQVDLPLPWIERAGVSGAVGYRRGRFVDPAAEELTGRTEQLTFDLGLGYAINPAWVLAARLQSARQLRENPMTREMFGIGRRTFTIVLTGRFPSRIAALVPPEGTRVDERNQGLEAPAGADGVDPR